MTTTPLGPGQEVGRSCHLLEFRGMTIMLDRGIHPGYELSKRLVTCQEVCTGCGTWCVEEIRKKEGCVVRKYKKNKAVIVDFFFVVVVLSGGRSENTFEKSFRAVPARKA
jgi:hypothetical protein